MPRLRPVLARTHWFLLRSFLFSSPTPRATLVISGCRSTSRLMAQEQCVLALPSCEGRVLNMYGWDLTHHCVQVPFSVKNTSSLFVLAVVWIWLWLLSRPSNRRALDVSLFYCRKCRFSGSGRAL